MRDSTHCYAFKLVPRFDQRALDITITGIATSPTATTLNPATINVTVTNNALDYETFQLNVNANTTIILTRSVTLTGANSTTITFNWDATGFAAGNYTISAHVPPAPGEANTADNTYVGGTVEVLAISTGGGGGGGRMHYIK